MATAANLVFQFMWIWPYRRIDSAVFVFCTKFGSNIYYSHWDRRTYASDLHLMTSRELTFGVDFWWVVISAWPWCIFPYNLMQDIFLQSKVIDIFFEIQDGGRRHLGFSVYVNLAIPALLTVCYLCSVPNLVQIIVIVTEINAHLFRPSSDDVTRINFRFRLLIMWSSPHGRDTAWPWCIFPYNLMQGIFIQSKVIDIFPKFKTAAAFILDFQFMWIWPFRRVDSVVFVFCTKYGSNISTAYFTTIVSHVLQILQETKKTV